MSLHAKRLDNVVALAFSQDPAIPSWRAAPADHDRDLTRSGRFDNRLVGIAEWSDKCDGREIADPFGSCPGCPASKRTSMEGCGT